MLGQTSNRRLLDRRVFRKTSLTTHDYGDLPANGVSRVRILAIVGMMIGD